MIFRKDRQAYDETEKAKTEAEAYVSDDLLVNHKLPNVSIKMIKPLTVAGINHLGSKQNRLTATGS